MKLIVGLPELIALANHNTFSGPTFKTSNHLGLHLVNTWTELHTPSFNPFPGPFLIALNMKRRVTYITAADAQFDPLKQAILSKDSLSIRGLDAAKEERITLARKELPTEVDITTSLLLRVDKADSCLCFGESSFWTLYATHSNFIYDGAPNGITTPWHRSWLAHLRVCMYTMCRRIMKHQSRTRTCRECDCHFYVQCLPCSERQRSNMPARSETIRRRYQMYIAKGVIFTVAECGRFISANSIPPQPALDRPLRRIPSIQCLRLDGYPMRR